MLEKNMQLADNTSEQGLSALGRQVTIEYYDCDPEILLCKDDVEQALLKAAKQSGATVISTNFHKFNPQGVSGVVVIAESHFTVHAWPEHNYAAVDIFTCADTISLEVAVKSMEDSFESKNVVISSDQNRGLIARPFEKSQPDQFIKNCNIHPISWEKEYNNKLPWGVSTSVDIYKADPSIIQDADQIKEFVYQLCDLIEMKRYKDCQVVHFGQDEKVAGFSMTQLIETSLISGHFANQSQTAYLDIFSCKFYEPRQVAEFALEFFKGEHYKMQIGLRQ